MAYHLQQVIKPWTSCNIKITEKILDKGQVQIFV